MLRDLETGQVLSWNYKRDVSIGSAGGGQGFSCLG